MSRTGPEGGGPAGPAVRARVIGARLRGGAFARPGDALTLVQGDATTCGATAVLAARLLLGEAPPALAARRSRARTASGSGPSWFIRLSRGRGGPAIPRGAGAGPHPAGSAPAAGRAGRRGRAAGQAAGS